MSGYSFARIFAAFVLAGLPEAVAAQSWSFEAYVGDAYNFRTRLEITQGGFSRTVDADYETRGFETPLYYLLRVGRWREASAWELALVHHKIYLRNPPEGVADVSISHGFNIVSVNRAGHKGDWTYRAGVGPVITHAEATINGVRYDGPYRVAGAALVAGGGRRFNLGKSVFASVELMATAAYAKPTLPGTPEAQLETTNVALHALVGFGIELR